MKEGDYIIRIWPSGNITMGIAHKNNSLCFKSLQDYAHEGGNTKGVVYGAINFNIIYREATPMEIEIFKKFGDLSDMKRYKREMILDEIL